MNVTIGNPGINAEIKAGNASVNAGQQIARYVVEPYVAVEETEDGAIITCTAQGQTTTGEVYNGADGKDGKDGATGATPNISATATTLAAGASATAVVSGTPENPLITFGIPKGDKGDPGTTDYTDVTNKPQINNVTLSGNKSLHELGIAAESDIPTIPVTSVNTKTGDVTLSASDVGALPSGTAVNTVKQNYPDPTQYSYWRPLVIGKSSNSSKTGAFVEQTDEVYTFSGLRVQPSTNTIVASTFEGNLTGTASGNYVKPANGIPHSDLENYYAASHSAGGAAELTVAIPYGEVDSTSTNVAYTATVPGVHQLKNGVCCYIRNDVVTGTTGCTLDVNNLGAKPMYSSNADATRVTSAFSAASTWLLVYNEARVEGGCWDVYYGSVNSNTIGYQLRTNSLTLPLKTYCGRYRLLFTSADGEKFVPANADSQTSAAKTHTVTTEKIDPFGEIFYYGSTSVKQANELPAATVLWQQYVATLGYSFNSANAALTLTVNKPVYITATPQSDGSAVLDYFTQDRPSTADGKIYIFLGIATAATTVEMTMKHPIYYHDGTRCRIWNGDPAAFNL